ncbi:hypothetical protein [Acutalibacter intestini]|uniref:hypothetical protein n=1 Tax=Acutalibacter intestini TaxID=3093659 RepID=UPI002AC95EEB|nr:hypothetical protein [Acutalibacter sp. M00204]
MLRKMKPQELQRIGELAYRQAMDLRGSAFPVYTDGVKTKEDFLAKARRGLDRPGEELLVYEQEGVPLGWAHYYWLEEEQYIGPHSILAGKNYSRLLGELLAYWAKRHPGYRWHLYLPEENREAIAYLTGRGQQEASQENVDVLLFENYAPRPAQKQVVQVGPKDFSLFQQVHRLFERDMYWTSERIAKAMENWELFACVEQEVCQGVLYYTYCNRGQRPDLEIFGIDLSPQGTPQTEKALLVAALNHAKGQNARSMYFFNEGEIHQTALGLGFRHVTTAHYFEGNL